MNRKIQTGISPFNKVGFLFLFRKTRVKKEQEKFSAFADEKLSKKIHEKTNIFTITG
ncbi:MAG TPA: hypothetical protein VFC67_20840 [Prolixibacteraceae bacterium]|nr:hypothetical protein [Prolixibacteraceae bacterium]